MAVIQYIYLIQTREFVNSGEPIYKIGKTKQENYTRFMQYPNGSIQLFQSACNNCDILEQKVIKLFSSKYENKKCFGKEYFKGDVRLMINDLCHIISNQVINATLKSSVKEIVCDIVQNNAVIEDSITDSVIIEDKIVEKNEKNKYVEQKSVYVEDVMYDGVVVEDDFEYVQDDETKKFFCKQCRYYSTYYGNIKQHYKTKKHMENVEKKQIEKVIVNKKFICTNCDVNYRTQSGLWKHRQKCKTIEKTHPDLLENGRLDRVLDNLEEFLQMNSCGTE
jgi:hypothetical protein